MKPGPAISSASTQRSTAGFALQRGDQLGARPRAGCACSGLGQLHRRGEGEVAVRGLLAATRTPAASGVPGAQLRRSPRAARRAALRWAWIIERFYGSRRLRPARAARGAACIRRTACDRTRRHDAGAECVATPARCRRAHRPMPDRRRCRAPPMPSQIGKYRVLGRLGEGATSEVFLGYDDFHGPRRRDQAGARRRPAPTRSTATTQRALLRRRGGAGRPPAAPERGADLRRGARPDGAVPGDGVRARRARCGRTAAPTSCCRSSRSSRSASSARWRSATCTARA